MGEEKEGKGGEEGREGRGERRGDEGWKGGGEEGTGEARGEGEAQWWEGGSRGEEEGDGVLQSRTGRKRQGSADPPSLVRGHWGDPPRSQGAALTNGVACPLDPGVSPLPLQGPGPGGRPPPTKEGLACTGTSAHTRAQAHAHPLGVGTWEAGGVRGRSPSSRQLKCGRTRRPPWGAGEGVVAPACTPPSPVVCTSEGGGCRGSGQGHRPPSRC